VFEVLAALVRVRSLKVDSVKTKKNVSMPSPLHCGLAVASTAPQLPDTITFEALPMGAVTIKKGQLGYRRTSRVRFRAAGGGKIWFPLAKHKCHFIQTTPESRTFARVESPAPSR
jgi:hypothetical protein